MSVLHGIVDGKPGSDPIGFILTDNHLVTVRYIDPKPFVIFAEHLYAEPDIAGDARTVFVRLLDAIVDRLADEFEVAGKRDRDDFAPHLQPSLASHALAIPNAARSDADADRQGPAIARQIARNRRSARPAC